LTLSERSAARGAPFHGASTRQVLPPAVDLLAQDTFVSVKRRREVGVFRFRRRKMVGVLAVSVAAVMSVSAYAFTASNSVPNQSAGAGSAVVSGYTISSPTNYTFSPDGTTIESVSFDLNKAASDVQVALTAGAPTQSDWVDCGGAASTPYAVTCNFAAPIPVGSGTQLSVAAVSSGTVTIAAS
jgi:hypothetical protein